MRSHVRLGAKLRSIGVMGAVTAGLPLTSLPALGAEGTYDTVEGRLWAGTRKSAGAFFNLEEAVIPGDPGNDGLGKEYTSADAQYTLSLRVKKRRGAPGPCHIDAVVAQWSRTKHAWVIILERRLSKGTATLREVSVTTTADHFRRDGQPTWMAIAANGSCAAAQARFASSLPWHDA